MNKNKLKSSYITDIHHEYGIFQNFILTKFGSLIGAIEVEGRDADSLVSDDHIGLAFIMKNIYEKVDKKIAITQYYSHFDNVSITLKPRANNISNNLSIQLSNFLSAKNLTSSHLIHYFEIFPSERLNKLNFIYLLKHAMLSPFSKRSQIIFRENIQVNPVVLLQLEELEKQAFELDKTLKEVSAKLTPIMSTKICSPSEMWAHKRFISTLDSSFLSEQPADFVPDNDWDKRVQSGNIETVVVKNTDMLKVNSEIPRYARIASITSFGDSKVQPGVWAFDENAPLSLGCNFIAMMRWNPLSAFQMKMLFKSKKDELERSNLNVIDMLSGNKKSILDKHLSMNPAIKQRMDEISEEEASSALWGVTQATLLTFDKDPNKLIHNAIKVEKAFSSASMKAVWESVHLPEAFKTIQLSSGEKSLRDIYFKSSQFGAASLIYKPSEGQKVIQFSEKEEAQYIFQTRSGELFHYSPYVGGVSLEICVGKTRSGKTFTKNTMDSHFLKYGGLLRNLDIDPGSEMLVNVFENISSLFKISDDEVHGLNPFISAQSAKDSKFIVHIKTLLLAMLESNDQRELKQLQEDEQEYLDRAILDTLKLPKPMQRLGTLVSHMPKSLARKFYRYIHHENDSGMYADLFDAAVDSIGELTKNLAVFNLQGIAKDVTAVSLVMLDAFFRFTRSFEDPKYLNVPKKLTIDEFHHLLKYPHIIREIERNIRTWGKYHAGISLWTQSPMELLELPNWEVLRSSATSFIFTADPQMKPESYQKTFGLTLGECEQIATLIPKKEIFIVQRELGISKRVILEVDKRQYVVSTSNPIECAIRNDLIKQYGFEEGIEMTVKAFDSRNDKEINKRNEEINRIKSQYYESVN